MSIRQQMKRLPRAFHLRKIGTRTLSRTKGCRQISTARRPWRRLTLLTAPGSWLAVGLHFGTRDAICVMPRFTYCTTRRNERMHAHVLAARLPGAAGCARWNRLARSACTGTLEAIGASTATPRAMLAGLWLLLALLAALRCWLRCCWLRCRSGSCLPALCGRRRACCRRPP